MSICDHCSSAAERRAVYSPTVRIQRSASSSTAPGASAMPVPDISADALQAVHAFVSGALANKGRGCINGCETTFDEQLLLDLRLNIAQLCGEADKDATNKPNLLSHASLDPLFTALASLPDRKHSSRCARIVCTTCTPNDTAQGRAVPYLAQNVGKRLCSQTYWRALVMSCLSNCCQHTDGSTASSTVAPSLPCRSHI